jgi:response regulator RpfG family c-di-GMP phosphodiesterase
MDNELDRFTRVLMIDDDRISNFINLKLMNKVGFREIFVAENGEQAIELLKKDTNVPELIFLDINMPVMDGFGFLEDYNHLKITNREKVKICVLTSSTHPDDVQKMKELGIKHYISKPLSEEKIRECFIKDTLD